ncbi:unnamed protein product [Leptidea sinapis]|uniref:Anaphase-promoting complex subunit 4-like WD40 domain-containing protein n=1 Tax=Leptidea sinapis TaxID=189913 RepID=A0A5E4PLC3_9NEOP|nr:unnamed protein product [Leptidea sinapis]
METKIHRIRYYNPEPKGINCISYEKKSKLLALSRKDASIEIWDLTHAPYLIKFIPGLENSSVEALGWVNERLLSTGLGGALIEWDLEKLCIKNTVILTGYEAWCLDVSEENTLVAIGTEQGYLNLYSVENNDIVYKKLFDKQEGRILCCKFDKTGNMLVTGSIDNIRVWNVHNGQATCRISCSRRGKEVIVWCVGILSDNTIISGDSHGRLTFWDGVMGDQIETYATHKADVLSLVISDDEQSLYCSGVDPIITMFMKVSKTVEKQASSQWVKNVQRNIHEHDVRGLALNDERLISVGEDGYLTLSSFPPKRVMRIPPMIPSPRTLICPQRRLLLLRYKNYLEVWKLGAYAKDERGKAVLNILNIKDVIQNNSSSLEQDTDLPLMPQMECNERRTLKLTEEPLKLTSIHAKGKKDIKCCDISPSGELIIYSTDSHC